MLVDIIGVVKEVLPLGTVKRKSDGMDLPRRDLVLVDQRLASQQLKKHHLLDNILMHGCAAKPCMSGQSDIFGSKFSKKFSLH